MVNVQMTMEIRSAFSALIVSFSVLTAGCNDIEEFYIPPRIVPGVSIDGVRLGDLPESVEKEFGKVAYGSSEGGFGKAWFVGWYRDGSHAGLKVYYIDLLFLGQPSQPGPVDKIVVQAPYEGKTEKGIGIGSSVSETHVAYGAPFRVWTSDNYLHGQDFYCYGDIWVEYNYQDSIVVSIAMGVLYHTRDDRICG
jgi:hypothetical protein